MALLYAVLSSTIFFATSFLTFEDRFLSFATTSTMLFHINSFKSLCTTLLMRILSYGTRCRDEQHPYCTAVSMDHFWEPFAVSLLLFFLFKKSLKPTRSCTIGLFLLSTLWSVRYQIPDSVYLVNLTQMIWASALVISIANPKEALFILLGSIQRPQSGVFLFLLRLYFLFKGDDSASSLLADTSLFVFSFFATGHQASFELVHWESAFYLVEYAIPNWASGGIIFLNTFSGPIAVLLFCSYSTFTSIFRYITMFNLMSSISLVILRKHLMIWKIFGSRYAFQIGFNFVLSFVYLLRTTAKYYQRAGKQLKNPQRPLLDK